MGNSRVLGYGVMFILLVLALYIVLVRIPEANEEYYCESIISVCEQYNIFGKDCVKSGYKNGFLGSVDYDRPTYICEGLGEIELSCVKYSTHRGSESNVSKGYSCE